MLVQANKCWGYPLRWSFFWGCKGLQWVVYNCTPTFTLNEDLRNYRMSQQVSDLGWVDFDFWLFIPLCLCLYPLGLMGNWQNRLNKWARWGNIIKQSQPNQGPRSSWTPCNTSTTTSITPTTHDYNCSNTHHLASLTDQCITKSGKHCVFPWKYHNEPTEYTGCVNPAITKPNHNQNNANGPWCATQLTDGKYVENSGTWGYCSMETCNKEGEVVGTVESA